MKKPMKAYEFFELIIDKIKEQNRFPKITKDGNEYELIDYTNSSRYGDGTTEITYYEFDIVTITKYGGCEGIYTDVSIVGRFNEFYDNGMKELHIGTIKTLFTDEEAMYSMFKLAADVYIIGTQYINDNIDDFSWLGFSIRHKDKKGGFEVYTEEAVVKKLVQLKDWYHTNPSDYIITDLRTRKVLDTEKFVKRMEAIA